MWTKIPKIFVMALLFSLNPILSGKSTAEEPVKIKLGTLAPKGSVYCTALQEMGESWRQAQSNGAMFTVYPDGTQGGEADVVRRMRIGQLNAGLLSIVGLSEIDSSVSGLQKIPLMFRSWDEYRYVLDKMRPSLEKRLYDKGFVVLFWVEAGWIKLFSREAAIRPDDFKRLKIFVWFGDENQVELMKSIGYKPVALETSDILPALQTGMIDMVPLTPLYTLTYQFYSPLPHMLDINWVPLIGAAVITRKAWDQMSPAGREALVKAAAKAGADIRVQALREDQQAIEVMQKRGLTVHSLTPQADAEWHQLAAKIYPMIRGKTVPTQMFDEVNSLVQEYRNKEAKK
ncbi:MAG TPA: TRAP transporter substrate-binding protein DctP [Burkholderiales bacterium]|nr:TRAP transporter substrate-binding protein DctP [Burkholderiales bacterium]